MINESFKDYVLDQLADLSDLRAKRMFSGFGLYTGRTFFGIISNDRLYFKTDEQIRARYIAEEMKPFSPSQKQTLKNYYEVPAEVLENRAEIAAWAEEAAGL